MFFKKKYNLNLILGEFVKSYSLIIDSEHLIESTKGRLKEFFPIEECCFFFEKDGKFVSDLFEQSISKYGRLVRWLIVNSTYFDLNKKYAEYSQEDYYLFQSLGCRYIFPLETHNKLIGIAIIKSENLPQNILEFLLIVFRLTAIAYDNAINLQAEKKKFKENLSEEKKSVVAGIASMMAHEIKNPLTSIRSTIQILNDYIENSEMKELAKNLVSEVDRINNITNSVLKFARPPKLNKEEVNICETIKSVKSLFTNILEDKKISFILPDKNFENMTINIDEQALRQILNNFMKNSINALENSKYKFIKVKIKQQNKHYLFEWEDSGEGIPKDKLEKIFEPFFTTKSSGNGLGLAICKKLLEEMNYDLNVISKVGKGTVFYFNLEVLSFGKKW
jgi:signal transduction histidine kinase